jgi:hypothetical protein
MMKALSGRQPWWWLLLHGKHIENRRWSTTYRGPILLHAARGCTVDEYEEAFDFVYMTFGRARARQIPPLQDMPRGGIVGRARIVDVIPPGGLPPASRPREWSDLDMRWHMPEQYGFVLRDIEPLPFVPCRGALGLFDIDLAATARPPASIEEPK